MEIPLSYYLLLGAILFAIGGVGTLTRRNAIVIFMGMVTVFFVMAVAAAEAAVGLAIVIALYRNKPTVNVDEINILKW